MKEVADWSSKGPQPDGNTVSEDPANIPEWASLLPELVQRISDHVLSTTGGVDAYMDMRAVCRSWRSAITKPSPLAAVDDPRFRPRHWIMLDMRAFPHEPRLFLHVPTGRFRRLLLPVLRDYRLAGISDGLLVLMYGFASPERTAHVLNPFTGDMLNFAAEFPEKINKNAEYTSVNGVVLLKWGQVLCAAPNSNVFTAKRTATHMHRMVNFQGNIYCANVYGDVFKYAARADQCDDELVLIAEVCPYLATSGCATYLVESAGELLLARHVDPIMQVFIVNVELEHEFLEYEVGSLGGHALFLGDERCVSVDADKFPSVDPDCIYNIGFTDICVYNIRGDKVDTISRRDLRLEPGSIITLLMEYCTFHSNHV